MTVVRQDRTEQKVFSPTETTTHIDMMLTSTTSGAGHAGVVLPRCFVRQAGRRGRGGRLSRLSLRASDDDEIPILSGRMKRGFTEEELERMKKPQLLGTGTSIGEELELLRETYLKAEQLALEQQAKADAGGNWKGDVYVGSNLNSLSVLYGIFMMAVVMGLIGAAVSYGSLWGVDPRFHTAPPPLW